MEEQTVEEALSDTIETEPQTKKQKFQKYLGGYIKQRYHSDPEFKARMIKASLASRAKKKEYYKQVNDNWREENKEHIKEYMKKWNEENKEKIKKYRKKWNEKKKEQRRLEKEKEKNKKI